MRKWIGTLCATVLLLPMAMAAPVTEGTLLNSMDEVNFAASNSKAHVELVDGKVGKALKFSYDNDCVNAFLQSHVQGSPEWDKAAGFSFWVKGDGSTHLGGIEFIWNNDYALRYGYAFPINSTEWKKVTVAWSDLIPEKGNITLPIDPENGNAPSKLGPMMFGKWWYWKDYAAHSYAVDDIRLEPTIPQDTKEYRPLGAPLARTLAKLKAGKPITIVTVGDSLTDYSHWSNHEANWPTDLKTQIKQKFGSDVTIINPAMGGTTLRQNMVILPRWSSTTEPDLVTIFFGFNDWNEGMHGEAFTPALEAAIDRVRRVTKGHADVLVFTTAPQLENRMQMNEMAAACRQAAKAKNAGICDVNSAFQAYSGDKTLLFASDKVHLGRAGQILIAQAALNAIEKAGK